MNPGRALCRACQAAGLPVAGCVSGCKTSPATAPEPTPALQARCRALSRLLGALPETVGEETRATFRAELEEAEKELARREDVFRTIGSGT